MKNASAENLAGQNHIGLPSDVRRKREREVLDEGKFIAVLCQERRRAERSGRPFALMLLNRQRYEHGEGLHPSVASTLIKATRGTDVVGWYKDNLIVGVLLTEFGTSEIHASLSVIKTKVCTTWCNAFPSADIEQVSISFHIFPEEWDIQHLNCPLDSALYPDLSRNNRDGCIRLVLKRCIDIVCSLFAILLLSPLFLVIAAIIRYTSRGPIIFSQKRVGQYGVLFTFYKFRSMYDKADATIHENYVKKLITGKVGSTGTSQVYKLIDDPRITRLGKFLRKTSLDELPQLFNVLKGDMSLVGPRPPLIYELEAYSHWHRRRLLNTRPGITGLWQVNGRSQVPFDDMVRLDLQYAAKQSLWLDLCILAKTPWVVLTCKGAF